MHYGSQLADELVHFGYPEFDEDFITDLKKEIPIAMELAKRDFDWESIEDSEQYHKRVLARARRERQKKVVGAGDDPRAVAAAARIADLDSATESGIKSWKDDPGERARRIWLWWRTWHSV